MYYSWRTPLSGLALIILLVVGFLLLEGAPKKESFAASIPPTGVKLSGWAWGGYAKDATSPTSGGLGWISFSCANTGSCQSIDYGVSVVRPPGGFSGTWETLDGYAWANPQDNPTNNIGWITFKKSDLESDPLGCPQGTCKAEVNFSTGEVRGWARACSVFQSGCSGALKPDSATGGWNGWIELAGTNHVSPDTSGLQGVTLDKNNCSLRGFAWQGKDDSQFGGWIKFDPGPNPNDNVSIVNLPPDQPKTLVLNPLPDYCAHPWNFSFQWFYSDPEDDAQTYYELQISTDSSFTDITQTIYDTGKTALIGDSKSNVSVLLPLCSPTNEAGFPGSCQTLKKQNIFKDGFDKDYFWRVKTWDEQPGLLCSNFQSSQWSAGSMFHTPIHDYPATSYTYSPLKPSAGETVTFTNGTVFDTNSSNQSYSWNFGEGAAIPTSSHSPFTHVYSKKGTFTSSLVATDDLGKSCSISQPDIKVFPPLPIYIEKPPTQHP